MELVIVCDGLVLMMVVVVLGGFVVLSIVGVLVIGVVVDFGADDRGLVATVLTSSCNCSGLAAPEKISIDVRTRRNIFLKPSDSAVGVVFTANFGVEG